MDPNSDQKGQNWAPNQVFCHFLRLDLLVFLEIAYNDSLQQCIRSSRGETTKKIFDDQVWAKTGQNQAQNQFLFPIFSSLVHQFALKWHKMIAWNNVQLLVEVKPAKNLVVVGGTNLGQTGQNQVQDQIFCYFLKFGSLVFL